MPNALKFQQTFDPTCACRRKGESWAQALAAAEAKYGHEARDILVTPGKVDRDVPPDHLKGLRRRQGEAGQDQRQARRRDATRKSERELATRRRARRRRLLPASPAGVRGANANGEDTALSAAAATVSREASGIAGGDTQRGQLSTADRRARQSPRPARTASRRRCG